MSKFRRNFDIFFTLDIAVIRRKKNSYMETLPLAEVRANLSKLVDQAVRTHQRVEVTRQGRRGAVLLSADDYDSLMETLDILGDAAAMAALREAGRRHRYWADLLRGRG